MMELSGFWNQALVGGLVMWAFRLTPKVFPAPAASAKPRDARLSYWETRLFGVFMSVFTPFVLSYPDFGWFRLAFWEAPSHLVVQLTAPLMLSLHAGRFLYEVSDRSGKASIWGLVALRFHVLVTGLLIWLWTSPISGSRVLAPSSLVCLMVVFDLVELLVVIRALLSLHGVKVSGFLVGAVWFMIRVLYLFFGISSGRLGHSVAYVFWGVVAFFQVLCMISFWY